MVCSSQLSGSISQKTNAARFAFPAQTPMARALTGLFQHRLPNGFVNTKHQSKDETHSDLKMNGEQTLALRGEIRIGHERLEAGLHFFRHGFLPFRALPCVRSPLLQFIRGPYPAPATCLISILPTRVSLCFIFPDSTISIVFGLTLSFLPRCSTFRLSGSLTRAWR